MTRGAHHSRRETNITQSKGRMRLTGDRDEWAENAVDQVHDVKSAFSEEVGVHQAHQAAAKWGVHRDHGRPGRILPLVAAYSKSAAKKPQKLA